MRPRDPQNGRFAGLWVWAVCAAVAVGGAALAYWWVEPAPPSRVTIAAGPAGGGYAAAAERYRRIFGENGVTLDVLETAGSVENYARLLDGTADLAIVQAGTRPGDPRAEAELSAVAAVYLEPLMVFHRRDLGELDGLADLEGRRIVLGPDGSGTRRLAQEVLAMSGVNVNVVEPPADLATADAVFVVASPDAAVARGLLADPATRLLPMPRARAVARRTDYLRPVVLPEGAVDLARNLPPRDVPLVAAAAVLATRNETHSAAVLLAAMAAERAHRGGTPVSDAGTFPNARGLDLPPNETARHYFKNGPNVLRRLLPFWASSVVERAVIVAVPLLALLIPLVRVAPPVYRWRVRSRIYKWYRELREIDAALDHEQAAPRALAGRLDDLEQEVRGVTVPLSYMEEFYNLRLHLGYLRRRVREQL